MVASQPPWRWYLFSKRLEAFMSINVIILVNHNDSEGGGYNAIMSLILPWSCRVRCLSRKICTQKLHVAIHVPAKTVTSVNSIQVWAGWACAACLFLKFELTDKFKGFSPTVTIERSPISASYKQVSRSLLFHSTYRRNDRFHLHCGLWK